MRKRRDFFGHICERLDIPREGMPGGFSLFLTGEREAVVRGCRRILVYESDVISLAVGQKKLNICGESLFCSSFGGGTVTVTGDIQSISLEEARR